MNIKTNDENKTLIIQVHLSHCHYLYVIFVVGILTILQNNTKNTFVIIAEGKSRDKRLFDDAFDFISLKNRRIKVVNIQIEINQCHLKID